ncbi:hypothetical protein BKK79_08025 [Cupriavidus sp. USMAA2-4]|uniref:hypothetical protein n=1 Tax=unclassified Cupriavidus TaxID=2640874 RepID=UPI0008A68326|nr:MULTISPECIES: hypothetical protein [unclassified Cupriavidus]AOY91752.1 hypothetical protein BKK79_08025 [Cupriavidus sp. USMAA2-4]AOY98690.1 hypothetical protein BKK81_04895 [Cupriavidus sp. USMAHM13]
MIAWLRNLLSGGRPAAAHPQATPDEPFVINLFEDRAVVHRPDGQREEVTWDALERVVIRVSDRAPWNGALWLILVGAADSGQGCVVPAAAVNYGALLARLQALPGFDQHKLDNARRDADAGKSRSDAICWKRGAGAEHPASDASPPPHDEAGKP